MQSGNEIYLQGLECGSLKNFPKSWRGCVLLGDVYLRSAWLLFGWKRRARGVMPLPFEFADAGSGEHPETSGLLGLTELSIAPQRLWNRDDSTGSVQRKAQACHAEMGVWPISFSYPRTSSVDPLLPRSEYISGTIPGRAYTFTDEAAYLDSYERAYYAISHKKGGWDCFRHLEILRSGAIPLMPDIGHLPKFSMVHYPVASLGQVAAANLESLVVPDATTRGLFQDHFNTHLTTSAMARYLLSVAGHSDAKRVLFVDENIGKRVDYLSVFTLIGLKQLLGSECRSAVPVPYLYKSWSGDQLTLYGRGFGYSRILDDEAKDRHWPTMRLRRMADCIKSGEVDLVVFGSIMRDLRIFNELNAAGAIDPERTVLLNGEDLRPTEESLNVLRDSGCHVFVRSIE